jgi:hypothetical protein
MLCSVHSILSSVVLYMVLPQVPHLLSGTIAPSAWLDTLSAALLALDLALDNDLLQNMLQVGKV